MNEMKKLILTVLILATTSTSAFELGDSITTDHYDANFEINTQQLYKTPKTDKGFSFTCSVGKAVPKEDKEGWYTLGALWNAPTAYFKARAVVYRDGYLPLYYGQVSFEKDGEALLSIGTEDYPIGWFKNNDGDIKSRDYKYKNSQSWSFNVIDGQGLYYESHSDKASYFLHNCKQITKNNLPVYAEVK